MPVEFNDYSIKVKETLNKTTIGWLYEAAAEVEAHAQRNCVMAKEEPESGSVGMQLKGSYRSKVDESAGEALVGSDKEAVYWEEFGTGSHAEHGDGRKGWWVYVKGGETSLHQSKTYPNEAEAQEAAEFLKARGKKAFATNGRDPQHTLQNAFVQTRAKAEARLEQLLKGALNGEQ